MNVFQHRLLMNAQRALLDLAEESDQALAAFEASQLDLFQGIEGEFSKVIAGSCAPIMQAESEAAAADRECESLMQVPLKTSEIKAVERQWVEVTERLLLMPQAIELAGAVSVSESKGSLTLFCRYFDFEGRLAAIDYPSSEGCMFHTPVPWNAHHIAIGYVVEPGSSIAIDYCALSDVVLNPEPVLPDDLALAQNENTRSFAQEMESMIAQIPDSNGNSYYRKWRRPRVGIVTDDFMFNYYVDALDLEYLTPEGYNNQLSEGGFDFVLYVSCWHGMREPDAEGLYEYRPYEAREIVPRIFERAKANGIPTVFQSIEDPPSYELFLPIAKAADAIFTTAVEVIPRYVKDTGNSCVFYQPYGINPAIHNPIGCMKKYSLKPRFYEDSVFFAGSWYGAYPERCHDTALLFDAVIRALGKNLVLADRTLRFDPVKRRAFPAEYNEFIIEPIEHKALQKAHKLFEFSINLNTIKDSETMGAMRVYEVQALGGMLISNRSKSLENAFPEVCAISDESDVSSYFSSLTQEEIVRRSLLGVRKIFSTATVYDRLGAMLAKAGIGIWLDDPIVHVFADTAEPDVIASCERQTYRSLRLHPIEEIGSSEFDLRGCFFAVLNRPCNSDFFFEDAMNAFKYTDVDFVEVLPFERYCDSFDYVTGVEDRFCTIFNGDSVPLNRVCENRVDDLAGFAIVVP